MGKVAMTFLTIFTRAILGALLISVAITPAAQAQDFDLSALQVAAESGDSEAQRKLGEALLFGNEGLERDKNSGFRLLEQASTSGNIAAKASLGKALLEGYYLPADHEKGQQLLEEAAAAGNPQAQTTLGVALLWGLYGEADPVRARALLDQAVSNGSTKAQRVLGEQLVRGSMFDQNVELGLPMLEKAVAAGDAKAKVALGSLLLDGTSLNRDQPRALMLIEEAAASGNGKGLERFGRKLMWSKKDPALAEGYLRRAGELGRGSAWTTLAKGAMYGYLGAGSRAKFDGFAEMARDAGEDRIAVLEAKRKIWGISMRASGPEAIEGLEQAAKADNKEAVKFLIGLVRSGNNLNVRKDPVRARAYLDRFSGLLSPKEVAQLSMSIDATEVKTISEYKSVAADFYAHPELKSLSFGKELYAANPNFAMYLLQSEMKRNGIYSGTLNGLATRSTLRSIWLECQTLGNTSRCGDTIMHPDVIGELLAR